MDRRTFLKLGVGAAVGGGILSLLRRRRQRFDLAPPAYSIVPVVADGKWIWDKPPEGQTGYLEPRSFSLKVGIELEGLGGATTLAASTPVPVECPEQKIEEARLETHGCVAQVQQLAPFARQLLLRAPGIVQGQRIAAYAHYKLTLFKQHHGYRRDQFPAQQKVPREVGKVYTGNSPGIHTRSGEVRQLMEQLTEELVHPWDKARAFASWIPRNIRAKRGSYVGVPRCLEKRYGDCEDMSALMVALCRAADIPARLVWVPNHNWVEFYLEDNDGQGHWIPAHVSAYSWWGWTGAHELVLQKGDRIYVPQQHKHYRLQEDWMQWQGRRPRARYVAELAPVAKDTGGDAGPGAREKIASGEWKLLGSHPLDRIARR